jgi:NAD(P)-dependent dehydrogenase (short-subunit alcohol dehydrogenase family)
VNAVAQVSHAAHVGSCQIRLPGRSACAPMGRVVGEPEEVASAVAFLAHHRHQGFTSRASAAVDVAGSLRCGFRSRVTGWL